MIEKIFELEKTTTYVEAVQPTASSAGEHKLATWLLVRKNECAHNFSICNTANSPLDFALQKSLRLKFRRWQTELEVLVAKF
jgi:hypothetical protein